MKFDQEKKPYKESLSFQVKKTLSSLVEGIVSINKTIAKLGLLVT